MHSSTAILILAAAAQVAPSLAAPVNTERSPFVIPVGTPPDVIAKIQAQFKPNNPFEPHIVALKRESIAGEVGEVAENTIGSALKKGALSGLGTLLGGAGITGILNHFDGSDDSSSQASKRQVLEYLIARADEELPAREGIAGEVGKVAETTIGSALKKGALSGLGTLLGGLGINSILGSDDSDSQSSKREFLEYLVARADEELAARGGIAGEVGKVAETTIGSALKKGALSGLGTLLGGLGINSILGSDDNQSSKREPFEYIVARADEELAARGSIAGEVGKVAETTIGSALKKGALSGLGTLLGGAGIGGLLDHFSNSDQSSKREFLEYIGERATQELAARAILEAMLDARAMNDLD